MLLYLKSIYKTGSCRIRSAALPSGRAARLLAAALLIAALPAQARAGDAVACFQSASSAKYVRDAGGKIPSSMLSQITSIEALVLRTARGSVTNSEVPSRLIALHSDEKVDAYVSRFLFRLSATIPALADRFRASADVLLSRGFYPSLQAIDRPVSARATFMDPTGESLSASVQVPARCALTRISLIVESHAGLVIQVDRRLFQHPRHSRFSQVAIILERLLEYDPVTRQLPVAAAGPLTAERLMLGSLLLESPRPTVLDLEAMAIDLGFLTGPAAQWSSRIERELDERLLRQARLGQAAFDEFERTHRDSASTALFEVSRDLPWNPAAIDIATGLQQLELELWTRGSVGRTIGEVARQRRLEDNHQKLNSLVEERRRAIVSALDSAMDADPVLRLSAGVAPGAPQTVLERFQSLLAGNIRVIASLSTLPDAVRNPFLNREFDRADAFLGKFPLGVAAETSSASAQRSGESALDDYPMPTSEQIDASLR